MQIRWRTISLLVAASAAFLMGGCGKDGKDGAAGKDTTSVVKVSSLTTDQWADLAPKGEVLSVSINSPPVVKFKVTDAAGNPIVGLGSTSKSSTATVASYPNVAFSLAKLVPGTNGSPSKWVNYIVTTVPTTTAAATATRPSTDNTGTLVDNGDGTYQYSFYRDITKIKDQVAAMTLTAPNVAADLGDLTYDPKLTHRLTIQVSGNAPGTGSNTPNGVTVTTGVAMKNPINIIYDFVPATGKAVTSADAQREITLIAQCNECHSKLAFHGGGRVDTRYCVVCHNDQRKFGRTEATTTATGYSGSTYRIGGYSAGDFPNMVHKIHMAEDLSKTGYDYAGVAFNHITYPQPATNCVKCHTKSAAAAQGDNWTTVPNRLACGACHDGINWSTGAGHVGGSASSDASCALCHSPDAIKSYHVTVDPTGSNGRAGYPANTAQDVPTVGYPSGQGPSIPLASQVGTLPAGVFKMGLEIQKVTVSGAAGAKKATVVYRILKDGVPQTLNATGFLMNNIDGSPSIQVNYAIAQDGISEPADWTNNFSATVTQIRDKANGHSQTGPDANGWYTATLATVVPDAAKMVTAAIGINYQGFVQLGHAAYPKGIRLREPAFVIKTADGYTARRSIVSNAKCNACHGQLGIKPSFHGGARNNGEGCALCHNYSNSNATGHVGASYSYGGGWSVSAKDLVHSIHAASKREWPFNYEATAEKPDGFGHITYPGVLKNCEQCHVAGSYDFSASANSAALPKLLWSTVAKGNMTIPADWNGVVLGLSHWMEQYVYPRGTAANFSTSRAANLVISPVSASCFGCHDSASAVAHMKQNGGKIYEAAGSATFATTSPEACMACHGTGKIGDIKKVHSK